MVLKAKDNWRLITKNSCQVLCCFIATPVGRSAVASTKVFTGSWFQDPVIIETGCHGWPISPHITLTCCRGGIRIVHTGMAHQVLMLYCVAAVLVCWWFCQSSYYLILVWRYNIWEVVLTCLPVSLIQSVHVSEPVEQIQSVLLVTQSEREGRIAGSRSSWQVRSLWQKQFFSWSFAVITINGGSLRTLARRCPISAHSHWWLLYRQSPKCWQIMSLVMAALYRQVPISGQESLKTSRHLSGCKLASQAWLVRWKVWSSRLGCDDSWASTVPCNNNNTG